MPYISFIILPCLFLAYLLIYELMSSRFGIALTILLILPTIITLQAGYKQGDDWFHTIKLYSVCSGSLFMALIQFTKLKNFKTSFVIVKIIGITNILEAVCYESSPLLSSPLLSSPLLWLFRMPSMH